MSIRWGGLSIGGELVLEATPEKFLSDWCDFFGISTLGQGVILCIIIWDSGWSTPNGVGTSGAGLPRGASRLVGVQVAHGFF